MLSKLFQPAPPFPGHLVCGPCRQEQRVTVVRNGYRYHYVLRDKLAVEDPYLVLIKATAFAIQQNTGYPGDVVPRTVRDFLIKSAIVRTQVSP